MTAGVTNSPELSKELTYAEAQSTILTNIDTLDVEEKSIAKAENQVLAEDVYADTDVPAMAISSFDGYAVRAEDVRQASRDNPVVLEDTDEPENKSGPNLNQPVSVKIYIAPAPGGNISAPAAALKQGDILIPRSTVIRLPQIITLASAGKCSVKVIRRPRVAIMTTGDELVKIGHKRSPARVYDSNAVTLRSLAAHYGGTPLMLGIARDTEASLTSRIKAGLSAIEGPPAGCLIDFEMLVRPAFLKMRGMEELDHPVISAVSTEAVNNPRPGKVFRWIILTKTSAGYTATFKNAAKPLIQRATANALTILPPNAAIKAGDEIQVWPLDWYK
jgi:molybdopterin molybdotransferase